MSVWRHLTWLKTWIFFSFLALVWILWNTSTNKTKSFNHDSWLGTHNVVQHMLLKNASMWDYNTNWISLKCYQSSHTAYWGGLLICSYFVQYFYLVNVMKKELENRGLLLFSSNIDGVMDMLQRLTKSTSCVLHILWTTVSGRKTFIKSVLTKLSE